MVPMPQILVLVVCKVLFLGPPDDNALKTGWRDTEWDTRQGVMHCQRHEIQLYDRAVDQGALPQPFNQESCRRTAMTLGPQYDVDNRDRPWRFWRSACPTPIFADKDSNEIVGWHIPECGSFGGTVICELDSVI